jgi:hypothetical protein
MKARITILMKGVANQTKNVKLLPSKVRANLKKVNNYHLRSNLVSGARKRKKSSIFRCKESNRKCLSQCNKGESCRTSHLTQNLTLKSNPTIPRRRTQVNTKCHRLMLLPMRTRIGKNLKLSTLDLMSSKSLSTSLTTHLKIRFKVTRSKQS